VPSPTTNTTRYTEQLLHYITTDHQATSVVFGIFTHAPWNPGDPRPHEDMLDGGTNPTDDEAAELIAYLKFITVRDRLIADIPGIDESMRDLLLGQTRQSPHWHRVDRATEVLFHH